MTTVPLRGMVDVRRDVIDTSAMPGRVEHFSIPALDAGSAELVDSVHIDSHKLRLLGGEVLISRLNPRKPRVHLVPPTPRAFAVASTEFVCLVPRGSDARFLRYCLLSETVRQHLDAQVRSATRSHQRVEPNVILGLHVPSFGRDEQRRIADFLDDRVSRIDRIIAARRKQMAKIGDSLARLSYDCVRGARLPDERREAGLPWLGTVPGTWPVLTVSSQFAVDLGKMLDEKRQTGAHSLPYLRNTNVQWDEVSVDDLKTMDIAASEYDRYTVEPGDLLICEGGQPGRGAIWRGEIRPLGYQKALHRARSRGRSRPEWLLECLRAAVGLQVFAAASGQTTIAHLTNEQLRTQRFPFPEPDVQDRLLMELHAERAWRRKVADAFEHSIDLLTEYKSSLITAAVTGELDVTTAGSNIPG